MTARKKRDAIALKRQVISGTRSEKPPRTQKAAPNPSQGGPMRSAAIERTAAEKMTTRPDQNHQSERSADCSIIVPARRARTGSIRAAARAGNHAAIRTENRPATVANKNMEGATAISRTLK